jgi:glycosyltransferase involved in cell wall biosynthesis
VLQLHNRYQQMGGEDVVVRAERDLLQSYGHEVDLLETNNAEIAGFPARMGAAMSAVYSTTSRRETAERMKSFQPDVVHVHNFFPLLSPSIYYACQAAHVPVVQTLHNYRLICPGTYLLRQGNPCEDCVGRRFAWPGIVHACYRGNRMGTVSVATMLGAHRLVGTWRNRVEAFVALSDFAKRKFVEGGLPPQKMVVKPNFVPDHGSLSDGRGGFALFVGRLSAEKGIATLLSAWEHSRSAMPLKVVGDGPLAGEVARRAMGGQISYLGPQPREKVMTLMQEAMLLIFPSVWFETFGLVVIEAFSVGLPVVASNLGGIASLVEHGRTGLRFRAGDPGDLAARIEWAAGHVGELDRMRREARAKYLTNYTPERNYQILMNIYDCVIAGKLTSKVGLSRAHAEISG